MTVTEEIGIAKLGELLGSNEHTRGMLDAIGFVAGSVAINGVGNDFDYVIPWVDLADAAYCLQEAGWAVDSAEAYRGCADDTWFSAKAGELNLLVCTQDTADLWLAGTKVCQIVRHYLGRDLTRDERVELHRAVFND